jgi:hypothetical protein
MPRRLITTCCRWPGGAHSDFNDCPYLAAGLKLREADGYSLSRLFQNGIVVAPRIAPCAAPEQRGSHPASDMSCNQNVPRVSNEAKRCSRYSQARHTRHEETMAHLLRLYRRVASAFSFLQSAMLLAVRLYWGFQFAPDRVRKITQLGENYEVLRQPQYSVPRFRFPVRLHP